MKFLKNLSEEDLKILKMAMGKQSSPLANVLLKHFKESLQTTKTAGVDSDGCTWSPDYNFTSCCEVHDLDYTKGGTEDDRLEADKKLRLCIRKKGHPVLAEIYFMAVREFGKGHFNYL